MRFSTPSSSFASSGRTSRSPTRRGFGIGVAGFPEGHPGTPNRLKELDYLKRKVDAGADYICTQLFFSNADFYDFRERCELAGIRVPIIAGIMPITSKENLARMAELALGARFPARLLRAIGRCDDDTEGGCQGRNPLGHRAMPRPARQPGPGHPFLHAQPLGCDPPDLREPRPHSTLGSSWSRRRPPAISRSQAESEIRLNPFAFCLLTAVPQRPIIKP